LVPALERLQDVRGLEIRLPATVHVAPTRLASLARFSGAAKATSITRLAPARRLATLVAFVHCLEATAQDEALEVLEMLLHDLFGHATQAYTKARLRTLKDLDQAAIVLVKACRGSHDRDSRVVNENVNAAQFRHRAFDSGDHSTGIGAAGLNRQGVNRGRLRCLDDFGRSVG
jgi:hypothetical protein